MLENRFGKVPDMEAILFLIGIQELGQTGSKFTKEQKQDLMHVAVCTLLGQRGYYEIKAYDQDGWPHFQQVRKPPEMDLDEQEEFLKEQVIHYFENTDNQLDFGANSSDQ